MDIVGVRFVRSGSVAYFEPGDIDIDVGDRVLVETEQGPREADVVIAPGQVLYSALIASKGLVIGKVEHPLSQCGIGTRSRHCECGGLIGS